MLDGLYTIHHRYFEKLKGYGIKGTRYSWQFNREQLCDKLFNRKETDTIYKNNKVINKFKDTFLYRMGGKGFSDQSDVPQDIHKDVFDDVMSEFTEKYGDDALNTVYTGFENDEEIIIYEKL